MPEFRVRDNAIHAVGGCAFCMEFEGPFIDTNVEVPGMGLIHVCAPNGIRPGCVGGMVREVGWPTPGDLVVKDEEISALKAEVADLTAKNKALQKKFHSKEFTMTAGELKAMIEA